MADFQVASGPLTANGQTLVLSEVKRPVPAWAFVQADGPAGTTFVVEASADGTVWTPVLLDRVGTQHGPDVGTITLTSAARQLWMVRHLFGRNLRIRCTGVTGTLNGWIGFPLVNFGLLLSSSGMRPGRAAPKSFRQVGEAATGKAPSD